MLTSAEVRGKWVLSVEDWAEIRRLHRAEWMPIKVIARVNRPGFGGGIDPTKGWSHVSTAEVSG